ncbi:unnamed protein product [Linum trigynum]|uniref:Uncharacterized protein n=1 Tax=Linum trigynum TaxID=586398 RepID=A0AAV2GGD7_9ROSI
MAPSSPTVVAAPSTESPPPLTIAATSHAIKKSSVVAKDGVATVVQESGLVITTTVPDEERAVSIKEESVTDGLERRTRSSHDGNWQFRRKPRSDKDISKATASATPTASISTAPGAVRGEKL